jgi:hypothetical protein
MRCLNVYFLIITSFILAACDRTPASDRGTVPDQASLARSVTGCGATLSLFESPIRRPTVGRPCGGVPT